MLVENIMLAEVYPKIKDTGAYMTTYIKESSIEIKTDGRPAMIIFPGGGYKFTSDREAEPVAIAFANLGFQCFVVRYSVAPHRYPQALLEGAGAVALVRRRSEEWNINPDKIAVMGFSAGAHCAGTVGTMWNEQFVRDTLDIAEGEDCPNAMVLCYPVISCVELKEGGSFENLLGENSTPELIHKLSLQNAVSEDTPPTFLWHTADDGCVSSESSLIMASALKKAGIKFELHMYCEGNHGLSLCNAQTGGDAPIEQNELIKPRIAGWVNLCNGWLKEIWK